jgi:uncharacterized protein
MWTRKTLRIDGMLTDASAKKIETALRALPGVRDTVVHFSSSTVDFSYDARQLRLKTVYKTIEALGYSAAEPAPAPSLVNAAVAKKELKIGGMTCPSCALRIESGLKKTPGILAAAASYGDGVAQVTYDPKIVAQDAVDSVVEKLGYRVLNKKSSASKGVTSAKDAPDKFKINQIVGIVLILVAGYLIIKNTVGFSFLPSVSQNMGYGLLFVVGLVTSLHCLAMCGGINLSQNIARASENGQSGGLSRLMPAILYNAGRVLSYTVIGGIVGGLGAVVSFSGTARGVVSILAGIFMVLFALNMLNIFPVLKKITPHLPKAIGKKLYAGTAGRGPFFIGLLNGLMPCGPLQAMQLYALGTGSPIKGALSMLLFNLGTVPLLFSFGALSAFLSGRFTHKMMKVSAALVLFLGVVMLGRGFALSGITLSAFSQKPAASGNIATVQGGVQRITMTLQSNSYTPITVQKGVPVKWIIKADAANLNGCNGTVTIPQYNIAKTLQVGDNEIDFTPQRAGTISYTCSMGMITSTISVVSDLSAAGASSSLPSAAAA